LKLLVTVTG
jgi:hypothetical protein